MTKKIIVALTVVTLLSGSLLTSVNSARANFPDDSGAWADQVFSFLPGKTASGGDVPADQQNAWQALGPAEGDLNPTISPTSGVSLGFGGQLTIKFTNTIRNEKGTDLRIVATHDGSPIKINNRPVPQPLIRIQASQNCWKWYTIGFTRGDKEVNLGPLSWATCIQLTDVSNVKSFMPTSVKLPHYPDAVGFRVDGVQALHTTANTPWAGTVHDLRWYKIDDSADNDVWLGHSIKANIPRQLGYCRTMWDQIITFHNNWTENTVYDGTFFRDAIYDSVNRSQWDGQSMDQIHDYLSTFTCNLTAARDPHVRNLYGQLLRINKGKDLWTVVTVTQ